MNRVVMIRIPEVGVQPEGKPGRCGGCGGSRLERWGRSKRRVRDVEVKEVEAVRWRCRDCGRTMREYPCGVGRASQTERVRVLVAIGWSLGLSLRAVVWWMAATVGVRLGVTTAWRDVRAVAEAMRRRRPARVRVLGVDGTSVRWGGQTRGMVVAVDLGTGRPVALAAVDERSPEAVRAWLQPLVEAYGVEVMVTDDLGTYRAVAEALGVRHRVCGFHRLRWALRALRALKSRVSRAWWPIVDEAMTIVRSRSPDGGRRLAELWRRMALRLRRSGKRAPPERLRLLLARLSDHWHTWMPEDGVPSTNNRTEQSIGRVKFRLRSTRGLKTWAGVEAAFWLTQASALLV